ncbi:MAG TPA: hypothetical protein VEP67_04920 [Thiobacillaceae bacterium]|nr:hypothetical protein [Thiobacillaceae bacterium]
MDLPWPCQQVPEGKSKKDLSPHLTLGAEISHRTEEVVGQGETTGFNLGGSVNFNEHDHLLFSAENGLRGRASLINA